MKGSPPGGGETQARADFAVWQSSAQNQSAHSTTGNEAFTGPLAADNYDTFWADAHPSWLNAPDSNFTSVGYTGHPPHATDAIYLSSGQSGRMALTTKAVSAAGDANLNKAHVIASVSFTHLADALSETGIIDLTDQSGHGIIFAGQNIYLGVVPITVEDTVTSLTYSCRILFRWKNVSLTEYIGVVTSQLSA